MINKDTFDDPYFIEEYKPIIYSKQKYLMMYKWYVVNLKIQNDQHTKYLNGYHRHHIRPRKLYPDKINDSKNLVYCTPKQHADLHYLFWRYSGKRSMKYACIGLISKFYKMTLLQYEQKVFPNIMSLIIDFKNLNEGIKNDNT